MPTLVCGVDWSGAQDAGRHVWLCKGRRQGKLYCVDELFRADELAQTARRLPEVVTSMRDWLQGLGPSVVGFDFPFSIPHSFVNGKDWSQFVIEFPERFPNPEAFRAWCYQRTGGKELKRKTDEIAKTPFAAYNLRMFRQTYWGIAAVLAPMVSGGLASVLPMQRARRGLPWLVETCPASVLKRLDIYTTYKGQGKTALKARARIANCVTQSERVKLTARYQDLAIKDCNGDALDAVLAGVAAIRAIRHPQFPKIDWHDEYGVEACVYF